MKQRPSRAALDAAYRSQRPQSDKTVKHGSGLGNEPNNSKREIVDQKRIATALPELEILQ